jgi:hypothetical protein
MRKLITIALLVLLAILTMAAAPPTSAARSRCFPETGFCVSDPLLAYWESHGGLPVFGYPLTAQRVETVENRTIPVQWFERDRLEIQQDGTITAGRLGARLLEIQGRRWEIQPRQPALPPDVTDCAYFEPTGRTLCQPFLGYWRANGGLERFGYPIGDVSQELIEGHTYTVQYFERRRIEQHPELAGTPYEFLYGLLGRDMLELQSAPACQGAPRDVPWEIEWRITSTPFRALLKCPTDSYVSAAAASQLFEGGTMIWVDLGTPGRWIYVYHAPRAAGQVATWAVYPDTYKESDPPNIDTPPADPPRSPIKRQTPQHGFGKVWAAGERNLLGWALSGEQPDQAYVQRFYSGGPIIQLQNAGRVWIFGPQPDQVMWNQ